VAQVSDLLNTKGPRVLTIPPTASVLEATELMNHHRIGALVVTLAGRAFDREPSCDRVIGMFTERDVLTRVVGMQRDPVATLVEEVMTGDVAFCRPETDVEEVASIMQKRRIRHLPVCDENGDLRGLVSIGDINAWNARGLDAAIQYLNDYIHGRA